MIEEVLKEIDELSKLENKQIPEMFIKFNEEFGEFAAEVVKMLGYSHKPYDQEHLKEEMADTLQCLLCLYIKICREKNILIEEIFSTITVKNKKWKEVMSKYTSNVPRYTYDPIFNEFKSDIDNTIREYNNK